MRLPGLDRKPGHFSEAQWADFARHIGAEEMLRAMQAHLETGCDACRSLAAPLVTVARMAVGERTLVISEELLMRARAIAEPSPVAPGWIESLVAITAQLIQSGPLDWQSAGVRSLGEATGPAGDQMLFRANDYAVHLRIETLLGGEAAEIVGEIVNEQQQGEVLEGIPVQMIARGQTISETATNRFGEFLIEYPIRKNTTLRFALKHRGQRIDLRLGATGDVDPGGDRQ